MAKSRTKVVGRTKGRTREERPAPRAVPAAAANRPRVRSRARARPAVETVRVTLDLRDVSRQPIDDPDTRFTFRQVTSGHQFCDQVTKQPLPAGPVTIALPVLAGDAVSCEIDAVRYRWARSPVFFRSPNDDGIALEIRLLRELGAWVPTFASWQRLGRRFDGFKRACQASGTVVVLDRGMPAGTPATAVLNSAATYDGLGFDLHLAQMALLNTHHVLQSTNEPVSKSRPWFSFVRQFVAIGRERFMALVDAEMWTLVRLISEHIDEFHVDYEQTMAENHRGMIPAALRGRAREMVSIKSSHTLGNFQLTLARLAQAGTEPEQWLLDADIDESGTLAGHVLDWLKHKRSGGTSPFDIHEILAWQHAEQERPGPFAPGYDLRPS